MAAGLGQLGFMPAAFWALTPRELDAALNGRFGNSGPYPAPTRGDLGQLMQRFPDGDRTQ